MSMNIIFFVIPQKLVFKKIWGSRDDNQANMEMPTLIKCLMCEIKKSTKYVHWYDNMG